jgi:hypothetical protein
MISEITGHGSLRFNSENDLYDFSKKRTETTNAMKEFFNLLSERFNEINASMVATLRPRLVLRPIVCPFLHAFLFWISASWKYSMRHFQNSCSVDAIIVPMGKLLQFTKISNSSKQEGL